LRIIVRVSVRVSVAFGTGHIEDDLGRRIGIFLGVELAVDSGEGTKELVGDVGEDGGTARGDFIFGEEEKEAGEEFVDGDGGAEFLEVGREGCGGFRGFLLILRELGVSGTVRGIASTDIEAATLAVGETMCATSGVIDGAGVSDLLGHFFFPWMGFGEYTPGATQKILKTRELREKQFVRP